MYTDDIENWILPRWGQCSLTRMEKGPIAVEVEEWLRGQKRAPGTKAKTRNIMSAICSHAVRWGWMQKNAIKSVRQSAKQQTEKEALTAEELQALFGELKMRERMLVSLDVPTGMRVSELMALQWFDFDFDKMQVQINRAIWHQHVGPVKTKKSHTVMPLAKEMVADLESWRRETPYAADNDWVFASARRRGRQPYWPDALMRKYIRPAAEKAGITKHISWHVFRHTFSTLLAQNGEDVATVQALMRHASSRVTMDVYTHAVSSKKRAAQAKVLQMILPPETGVARDVGGVA